MTVSITAETAGQPAPSACDWSFRAEGVTKIYGKALRANDSITLSVRPGEVYGLLGPNGAGKTTLVKQIIGLLKPDQGQIRLGPFDLVTDPDAARQLCSYLPQAPMPIDSFRVREAIELTGRIRGGGRAAVRRRAGELIEALDIGEWANTMGQRLSGGIRRLVGFSMVTVWPGRVVILDEPTNDVDPLRRRLLWDQIRMLGQRGCAVFLVTHNVMEAEKSVDRLAVISGGRLIAEGTPSSLKAGDRGHLRLQVMLRPDAATPPLPPWVRHQVRVGHNLITSIDEADGRRHQVGRGAHRPRHRGGVRARGHHPGGRLCPADRPHLRQRERGDLTWPPSPARLPFGHMAVIVRAGLTAGLVTGVASSYLIVAAWAVAGAAAAGWALGRRG